MAEVIACPGCNRKLHVPESVLGQQVQCPNCQQIFEAELPLVAVPVPPPILAPARLEPQPEELPPSTRMTRPVRKRYRSAEVPPVDPADRPAWGQTMTGLLFAALSCFLPAVAGVLGIISMVLHEGSTRRRGGSTGTEEFTVILLGVAAVGLVLITFLVHLLALVRVIALPRATGAPDFARGALYALPAGVGLLSLGFLLVYLGNTVFPGSMREPAVSLLVILVFLLGLGVLAAGISLFLLGLRRATRYFQATDIGGHLLALVIAGGILVGGFGTMMLLLWLTAHGFLGGQAARRGDFPEVLAGLGGCGVTLGSFAWSVWYIVALFQVRAAIESYLDER